MEDKELMTAKEIAQVLKVKTGTVYQLVATKRIPFHKVGGSTRFYLEEVMNYYKTK